MANFVATNGVQVLHPQQGAPLLVAQGFQVPWDEPSASEADLATVS